MDPVQILREFASAERLPVEAIEAARANRTAVVPVFIELVERFVADTSEPEDDAALFLVFHLLGEWREKSAYRSLAALMRLPQDRLEPVFGLDVDQTSHRVMAAVFGGDPAPLYEIIHDPAADECVRSRMCEALAMVTLRGELPREEATRFLQACFSELPRRSCMVWDGWQNAIAMLGLVELAPLVKQAYERGLMDSASTFEDFERDLQRVMNGGSLEGWYGKHDFELFGDTVEELPSGVYADPDEDVGGDIREDFEVDSGESIEEDFADEFEDDFEDDFEEEDAWEARPGRVPARAPSGPAVNPYKNVGRNDPCPCGSGRKFKKCCLGKADAPPPVSAPPGRLSDLVSALKEGLHKAHVSRGYDPLVAPDPEEWLALEEGERIERAMDFHRRTRIRVPGAKMHAVAHAVVENQIAEGDALPTRRTLERLMSEGLDRHDAIHAISMVLMVHLHDLMKAGKAEDDPNRRYFAELELLTAEKWRRSG